MSEAIIGFDSAWTDSSKAPGALSWIEVTHGSRTFIEPQLMNFAAARAQIEHIVQNCAYSLLALDQPTIVKNMVGGRPVERVAGSLISFAGGGVQPSSRSRKGMFDDDAPIWRFLAALDRTEQPEESRTATSGHFLIEVFPAIALLGLNEQFCARLAGPRYNPARRKTFKIEHWLSVLDVLTAYALAHKIEMLPEWADTMRACAVPKKADQDKLDSVICSLIGFHWRYLPREYSSIIGDGTTGYMVTPTNPLTMVRLRDASRRFGVPVA